MKHLLTLRDISTEEIQKILCRADSFSQGIRPKQYEDKIAANLFFEPSTRTQYSFNVAEVKLGMRVISFSPESSSLQKDESFYDTVKVIDSFGVDIIVIRHSENEYYKQLLGHVDAAILNGGDGTGDHPTQSLLDLMTIKQEFGGFEGLRCAIIGDIRHSRVAHTNFEIMSRLGMEVVTSGPDIYKEDRFKFVPFDEAVAESDIVMLLRVQHERHSDGKTNFSKDEYHASYGMNADRIKQMKQHAIIMHPAPFNRGVEIADEIVEGENSRIFKQMSNGVFVRMAVIERALEG
ncbi:MAG: aspartate carbamoyltransferase catalytic subunit [Oscillospiraceae bacterium]|nr:aspartate carbamoyltransferase catalytic subunit [Oscillospiraceae bacterium]